MPILSVQWGDAEQSIVIVTYDFTGIVEHAGLETFGDIATIGNGPTNKAVQVWLGFGNTVLPAA